MCFSGGGGYSEVLPDCAKTVFIFILYIAFDFICSGEGINVHGGKGKWVRVTVK